MIYKGFPCFWQLFATNLILIKTLLRRLVTQKQGAFNTSLLIFRILRLRNRRTILQIPQTFQNRNILRKFLQNLLINIVLTFAFFACN